jgi:hypothetical protein
VLRAVGDGRARHTKEARVLGRIAGCPPSPGFLAAVLAGARETVRVLPVTPGEAA